MYTIMDYLKYYKDYTVDQLEFNEADVLFFTILSYAPLDSFKEKSFQEFKEDILKVENVDKLWLMAPKVVEAISIVKESKRYDSLKVIHLERIINSSIQFLAITFLFHNKKIIVYEGTDGSSIGWLENMRACYQYPTVTQEKAIEYAKENVSINDEEIYFAGHSKGGNQAIVSAMNLEKNIRNHIKAIYNFDGPGLMLKEMESEEFKDISNRIINIVPEGSYIGTLLYNTNQFRVVKSKEKGFNVHYPTSWELFGSHIVTEGELSEISMYLHRFTTTGFDSLDRKEAEIIFEEVFTNLGLKKSDKFKLGIKDIFKALNTVHRTDEGTLLILKKVLGVMIMASSKGKKKLIMTDEEK